MFFAIKNKQTAEIERDLQTRILQEPAGTTLAILKSNHFVQGCRDEVVLTCYPIGGIVTHRRTFATQVELIQEPHLGTNPQQVAAGAELDILAAENLLDQISDLGAWTLPHTQAIRLDNRHAYFAISNGYHSHAIMMHSPRGIYHRLLTMLLGLVQLPSYSL